MKLAIWSGPRNLSTAMMYAFGNRADFAATDEPFYAAYLAETGLHHPMREAVLASQSRDPARVSEWLSGPVPDGKTHWYQKHMALHLRPGFPLDWARDCVHVHLIRHPARVIASYAAKREDPTLDDIGYARHAALFDRFPGPVLDSADIRRDPKRMLRTLCDVIGLDYQESMTTWPAGPKPYDGPWAPVWYEAVHASTGFAGIEGPLPDLGAAQQDLLNAALLYYEAMHRQRL
ncbi:MAG: hypothetical protein HLUCCA08_03055 [Rhodobacteraceae bacterium HLUCCA08]|nr:MAG: hypothetical protein HLUCCA08_03055 [Rhodobacteraceae bacterium HLUCCA08]